MNDDTSPAVIFGHLEPVAPDLFKTWVGDGDLAWARFAWPHVREASDVAGATPHARTAALVRLLALAAITGKFYAIAMQAGGPEEWEDLPTCVFDHTSLQADAEEAFNVAAQAGDEFDKDDLLLTMLRADILRKAPQVAGALHSAFANHLLPLLMAAAAGEPYPPSEEFIHDHLNSPDTGDFVGYGWIDEGMPL
jgi:hypothetical protein